MATHQLSLMLINRIFFNMKSCNLIDFSPITDDRGVLLPIEYDTHIPFEIKRVFFIYDTNGNFDRGGHANKYTKFVLIALAGSVDVNVKIDERMKTFTLNSPTVGLFIDNMVWKTMSNFSSGAILVAICSEKFDPNEYV